MTKRENKWIYAMYKGDKFLCEGTKKEISEIMNVSISTLNYYRTKHWIVNRKTKNGNNNRRILIRVDEEDKQFDLQ